MVQGGFAGAAVQLKAMVLEEAAVAVRLVGPVGGTEPQVAAAKVSALACCEEGDVPYKSTASTT
jgi:hypothetical protein